VTEILQKHVASCVTVHGKVLCDFVAEMELLLGFVYLTVLIMHQYIGV